MKLSRLIFAGLALGLSGCMFSLGYVTRNGTAIGVATDGQNVTIGATRPELITVDGRRKQGAFGISTTFKIRKETELEAPEKGGLAK